VGYRFVLLSFIAVLLSGCIALEEWGSAFESVLSDEANSRSYKQSAPGYLPPKYRTQPATIKASTNSPSGEFEEKENEPCVEDSSRMGRCTTPR